MASSDPLSNSLLVGGSLGLLAGLGALGSDTGGSIRLAATMCGVTGITGTQTRVSRCGAMSLSFSADNVAPLPSTARDCACLLRFTAGTFRLGWASVVFMLMFLAIWHLAGTERKRSTGRTV